ncbi:elongator complex protein 4-like [Polyodon spathula]|uniref:elongator complex protein 4-like n=1 Tax=Polyodon spathula TaxID=7913 RepID=UPI001B7D966D|nr:elongator complex protein 4-like [Polyodon spathula]
MAFTVACDDDVIVQVARDYGQELPAPLLDEISDTEVEEELAMKIAWRYQILPKVQTTLASSSRFGHYYAMNTDMCEAATCHSFSHPNELPLESATESSNMSIGYIKLRSIQGVIHKEGFDGAGPQNKLRSILRIGVHSLGSAIWGDDDDICCKENPEHAHSLRTFLYSLHALFRTSLSVCMVTVPSHFVQNNAIMEHIAKLCDTVVSLESVSGSERERNPVYKGYHGLLHVKHLSLMYEVPDTKDLAFKLKRKPFTIETLHLPPDLSDTVSRLSKQDLAESAKLLGLGCGTIATDKKHLDF